jgi:hypothetical protein
VAEHDTQQGAAGRRSRIPTFATVEDEAAFWDSHDTADFEDELEPIENVVFESVRSSQGLMVRFDGDILERVDRIATATGSDSRSVIKRMVEEGIRHESERDPRLAS